MLNDFYNCLYQKLISGVKVKWVKYKSKTHFSDVCKISVLIPNYALLCNGLSDKIPLKHICGCK